MKRIFLIVLVAFVLLGGELSGRFRSMGDTTVWTMTHIAFDTESRTWKLAGTRFRPPTEGNETFQVRHGSLFEAVEAWEAEAQRRDRPSASAGSTPAPLAVPSSALRATRSQRAGRRSTPHRSRA